MRNQSPSGGHPEFRSRPTVVCICGMLASGKSTLVRALAAHWASVPVLAFDDYEQHARWPADMQQWLRDGADPSLVSNSRLRDDLDTLVHGRPVQHPLTQADLMPSPLVLLEDPFGRTRPDIRDLIDVVFFVDLPADLSVVRLVRRALLQSPPSSSPHAMEDSDRAPMERIAATEQWLDHYVSHRAMYTAPRLLDPVRESSDIVLNGEESKEQVFSAAVSHIERRLRLFPS